MKDPAKPYGVGRIRSNVSYADVERAALVLLKSERRPTVVTVRQALGGGSPDTIGNALRRFWRDLGIRMEGDPAALTRMPIEIAELADGIWQRALKLAGDAATHDDNAARERLRQLEVENEIKQQSFKLRERECDAQARHREQALAEARDHLFGLSNALSREQAANEALKARIADLETQVENYRTQTAALIAAAIARAGSRPKNVSKIAQPSSKRRRISLPSVRGLSGRKRRALVPALKRRKTSSPAPKRFRPRR